MAAFVVFYTGTGIRVLSVTGAGYAQAENVPDQRGGGSHQQRYKTAGVPAEIPDVQELDENIRGYEDLVMYNLEAGEAMLTKDNDVDIFIDGNEKFRALMEDLRNAEHFIHIQYYIIKNDVLFNQIRDILIEKKRRRAWK